MSASGKVTGTWDPVWEAVIASRGWGRYPTEPVIREIMRGLGRAPDRRAVRILDLGCGVGANTWFSAREGFSVAAIDGSASGVAKAKSWMEAENLPGVDFKVGDFTLPLPWPDQHFDAVIDSGGLTSNPLPAIQAAVGHIHRVLKPGGFVVSLIFSDRTWGYGLGRPVAEAPGCYTEITEGPLAGIGAIQFLGRSQIAATFAPLKVVSAETYSYSMESVSRLVEYWVVKAVKGT